MKPTVPSDTSASRDAIAHETPRRTRSKAGRFLLRVVDLLIFVCVIAGLYVGVVGVPDAVLARFLRGQADQPYLLDVGRVRLNPLRGLVVDDLRLYRRHVIGPAVLEAEHAVAEVSVIAALRRLPILTGLLIENGILRPEMLWQKITNAQPDEVSMPGAFTLDLAVRQLEVVGASIDALEGRLSGDGTQLQLSHGYAVVSYEARAMEFKGDIGCDSDGVIGGKASGEGDPRAILPFFETARLKIGTKIINDLEFPEAPPRAEVEFRLPSATNKDFSVDIQFWMENAKYRGVEALHAEGRAEIARRGKLLVAGVRPLLIARTEGTGRGGFMFHITKNKSRVLEFEAQSALEPAATSQLIGVLTNECQTQYRFAPPYSIDATGLVDMRDPEGIALDAKMAFGRLTIQNHSLDDCDFRLRMLGLTNLVEDVHGTWQGGKVSGRAEWLSGPRRKGCVQYRAEVALDNGNLEQISRNVFHNPDRPYTGELKARLSISGQPGPNHRNSVTGQGRVEITKGRVFLLPVFGGLTEFLSRTIPGVESLSGLSDAEADIEISGGRIRSPHVLVEGDILSLMGAGSCGLDGTLDYDMQLTFLDSRTLAGKLIRIPTYLFSKLFEFKLTGTRANPTWYPVNFSKDLWQKRGDEGTKSAPPDGTEPPPVIDWDEKW